MDSYGLLWYDNNSKVTVTERAKIAVDYYKTKHGKTPNLCYVNPGMTEQQTPFIIDGLEFRVSRSILPNPFWIGVK